ncbi:MAG: sulfolactaldehyde 3-reductase [Alphaproteobacteria bacterium]|nr:sulfolactaldehyde 3-reductase [Alphaproteobacteria bacterium]
MKKIGFVGTGVMGLPMARNVIKSGIEVTAFDINPDALQTIRQDGGSIAESAKGAAAGADAVITMLPNGDHVLKAVFGENGAIEGMGDGALLIDMSTILPTVTDEVASRLVAAGHRLVDAPVGRTSRHAEEGKLLIMAGGEADDVEAARPVLECMGDTIIHCGPAGSGARMKLINNYMSIACNVVTAEALTLAEQSGLDRDLAIEVMMGTTAGQGHLATTYPAKVLKGDVTPGFMVDLAHKDMGLALDFAAALKTPMPMGAAARQVYSSAQVQGRGRDDWTAILETVRTLAGLK